MASPRLGVVLTTNDRSVNVGPDVISGLSFRSSSPGGYANASFRLPRSLNLHHRELDPFVRCDIYDTRTAEVVWAGRLENPGRTSSPEGQFADVSAIGGSAHTGDRLMRAVYTDARQSSWVEVRKQDASGGEYTSQDAGTTSTAPRMHFGWPDGSKLKNTSVISVRHSALFSARQRLARAIAVVDPAFVNADFRFDIHGRGLGIADAAADTPLDYVTFSVGTEQTVSASMGTEFFGNYYDVDLRLRYLGAALTVGNDLTTVSCRAARVVGQRYFRNGSLNTGPYGIWTNAAEVVGDLLGRALPQFDGANAAISTLGTAAIDQLSYDDGVYPAQVLEDLLALDPAFTWHAWEHTGVGFRFEFVALPTAISYFLDAEGEFQSPGSGGDLYNRVDVRYVDELDVPRSYLLSGSCPLLDAQGLIRSTRVDLGSEMGSAMQAATVASAFLAAHRTLSNNGTLEVSRPVADSLLGRTLQPWELKPGALVAVRGIVPNLDALNPTTTDGVSVFFVSETNYDADRNACTLTLDSYNSTVAKALAALARRTNRQVRR